MRWNKVKKIGQGMFRIFMDNNIPRAAAGLSYFLTLSLFPTLICLYHMLGNLAPPTEEIKGFLDGLLPASTADTILSFLRYVSANRSAGMLFAALVVLVTCASAAFRCVDNVTAEMRGVSRYSSGFLAFIFSVVYSLLLVAALYVAAIFILTGKWFLEIIDRQLMFMNVSDTWSWARFILLGLLLFVMLSWLYRVTAPRAAGRRGTRIRLMPGAVAAAAALLVVSMVFAGVIGVSAQYPLVYGSIASLALMMLWLYFCGIIVFMGNALNVMLERLDADGKDAGSV